MSKYWFSVFSLAAVVSAGCKRPARPLESAGKGGEKIYRSEAAKRTRLQLPDGTEVLLSTGAVLHVPAGFNKTGRGLVLEGEALFTVSPGAGIPFIVHTKALVVTVPVAAAGKVSEDTPGKAAGDTSERVDGKDSENIPGKDPGNRIGKDRGMDGKKGRGSEPGNALGGALLGTIFKVSGSPDSPGEEVDLLSGGLIVRKSYHSTMDNEPEILGPGEMVMVNTDIDLMEKEKFDTAELKAWLSAP